ncbi:ABC transporter permease [Nonomuraea sp. NPDC000554]|uniref:ABC transporter permease n=1 Tax=Nonomuraea sp. NPDC000554 TaxID=3154259 RepID=UPI0033335FF9
MSAVPATPPHASADGTGAGNLGLLLVPPRARTGWRVLPARVTAMCVVELQKLRHDRTELYTRAVQPALWLLIFGETFTRIKVIPSGGIPYLDYLAPGIIAQSTMFIAIFYGIQIIWERDSGVLTKLLVTPTPRAALVTGKAFAAGVKAMIQAVVVVLIAAPSRPRRSASRRRPGCWDGWRGDPPGSGGFAFPEPCGSGEEGAQFPGHPLRISASGGVPRARVAEPR